MASWGRVWVYTRVLCQAGGICSSRRALREAIGSRFATALGCERLQRLVGILPKAIARRCGTAAAPPARMGMVRRGGLRRAANAVVREARAANKRVTVMGGASTPAAAKMRPVAHTPGQLAAAAAFVQAWQASTPAPVADDAGRGATASASTASFDDERGATTASASTASFDDEGGATASSSSTASFDDERGTPSRRTLSFAESETFSETESSPGAPSPPRPRRRPWRRRLHLALLACALASGRASFRREPPRPAGTAVLPVRGVGLADRLLM